jgi:acetolactate synthase-1/2/3 large subunit
VPTDLLGRQTAGGEEAIRPQSERSEEIPELDEAVTLISRAKRPLILAGTDAVRSNISDAIISLSETLTAPVVTTTEGKGIIAEDHPLAFGNVVRKGAAREMVTSCDVVLAIGTRLRQVDTNRKWLKFPHLIHVDWDDRWINRNFAAEVAVRGDVPRIAKALADRVKPGPDVNQRKRWVGELKIKLEAEREEISRAHREVQYLEVIREALPREGVLVIDNTQLGYWAEYFYPSYVPGGLISAKGSAAIGFAFPGAIGAKVACPDKKIIALIGDGGFLYGAHELATCIRHRIGFPLILVNDNAYGIIEHLQRTSYQAEYESWLANPDFVALARAFGAQSLRVDSPEGLSRALDTAFSTDEMWVIELAGFFPEVPFGRY